MYKNVYFFGSGVNKKGTSSLQREMEGHPSKMHGVRKNLKYTSTLNLIEERKTDLNKKVNDKAITQYTEILPLETQMGKPTFLEHLALLLSYSFRIKGYMTNLGLHLRHNHHHTLFLYTRTTLQPIRLTST
jgi:hypothetical protein